MSAPTSKQDRDEWRRRAYARRILVNGRLVAPVAEERHGRATTYISHGCRCDLCRAAATRRVQEYRRKQKS